MLLVSAHPLPHPTPHHAAPPLFIPTSPHPACPRWAGRLMLTRRDAKVGLPCDGRGASDDVVLDVDVRRGYFAVTAGHLRAADKAEQVAKRA